MLKWALLAAAGVALLVASIFVVGLMLPTGHRASQTIVLAAAPPVVFAVITDFARTPEWRTDLKQVEMLPPETGRTRFREAGSQGAITYRVEMMEPPSRLVTRIADPSLPFGGTWTFELRPNGAGTELTITEDGEVYNPIFRFMSKVIFSPTETIEKYQKNLKRRVDK